MIRLLSFFAAVLSGTAGAAGAGASGRNPDALVYQSAADLSYRQGQFHLALEETNRCLALSPGDPDCLALRELARNKVMSHDGKLEKGTRERKQAAVRHWNSGMIYYQQGLYDKAGQEWESCRGLDPKNADCGSGLERLGYGVDGSPRAGVASATQYSIPFSPNSSSVDPMSQSRIEDIADTLAYYPLENLAIIGYAGEGEKDAEALAGQRAQAVIQILVKNFNADAGRLKAQAKVKPSAGHEAVAFLVPGNSP